MWLTLQFKNIYALTCVTSSGGFVRGYGVVEEFERLSRGRGDNFPVVSVLPKLLLKYVHTR